MAFAICLYFAQDILGFLIRPLAAAGQDRLIYTKLYEAFFVEMKVALFAAVMICFPIIANQLWAFVAPGLYAKEKRAFLPFLIATPVLFACGASLAYFVVMPTAFRWFLGFQGNHGGLKLEALPSTGDYLSLVMQFILAFGVSFLLPVLLLLLERAGIVTRAQLSKARRYVIVSDRRGGSLDHAARRRLAVHAGGAVAGAVRGFAADHVVRRAAPGEGAGGGASHPGRPGGGHPAGGVTVAQ